MTDPWFKESFGSDYLEIYPHRGEEEAEKQIPYVLEALALRAGQRVLDLACGAGRHTARLRRRSILAFGMDLSDALLGEACRTYPLPDPPPFLRGDMRFLPFARAAFDAVVNLFTSFGYFEEETENRRVLDEIRRVLRPGGRVLIDYLNPERVVTELVPRSEARRGSLEIIETRRFDADRGRVEKTIELHRRSGPRAGERRIFRESVGLFSLRRMRAFFEEAGMTVLSVHGDFDGSEYTPGSPRMILLGRRDEG